MPVNEVQIDVNGILSVRYWWYDVRVLVILGLNWTWMVSLEKILLSFSDTSATNGPIAVLSSTFLENASFTDPGEPMAHPYLKNDMGV